MALNFDKMIFEFDLNDGIKIYSFPPDAAYDTLLMSGEEGVNIFY